MKLKDIKPTAEVEYETKDEGTLRLTVQHIPPDSLTVDFTREHLPSAVIRAALREAIVGWNLGKEDGTVWECTPETRAALMPQLATLELKEKKDDKGKILIPDGILLGIVLFNFATTEENFLKN